MKNKKIIIILSVIISILIISLLIYVFYFNNKKTQHNTTNRIENTKTYSDDKYNFIFNYSSILSYTVEDNKKVLLPDYLIKSEKNQNNYETIDRYISFKYDFGYIPLSLNIYKNTKHKNVEDWLNDYVKNKPNEVIVFKENNGINIDNNKTIITHVAGLDQNRKYVFEDYPYEKTVAFIKNNNLFVINTKDGIGNESYIDFIKSFKFIK